MAVFGGKIKHAWNVFFNQPGPVDPLRALDYGGSYGVNPNRMRLNISNERSIIASIYTRIALDVASTRIRHIRRDDDNRYLDDIQSGLNDCFTVEANIDQSCSALIQDYALTLFDEGVACIVPVDTTIDPKVSSGFDIKTLRVGRIVQWAPQHVRINLYNERNGKREEITMPKQLVCIIENPLYAVMNEPNSTLQRLIRKLNLLDVVDEQSASGKLDLIIQLPYTIKSESRRLQAETRRKDIEFQLKGSQYGIAYTEATEKITQLNRPSENNLMAQVDTLMKLLYSQLGITEEIMNGSATEAAMLNYHYRTVEPIVRALVEEIRRKFLTKTARSQKQWIEYHNDPFKLVPIAQIAEIADKFARNEILSSNEIRGLIGFKPSREPRADKLLNSNMAPQPEEVLEGELIEKELSVSPTNELEELEGELVDILKELEA